MSTALERRLLLPGSALLWGLQFSFLVPTLALLLVSLYGASAAQVGLVLAVYNAAGFVAALVVPTWADRRGDYLLPMLGCAVLTLALALVLFLATGLPAAVVALVVLGAPAGVGVSLLFAHLRHEGATGGDVANVRAVVSFAWVAGPPLATFLMAGLGNRAVLPAIAAVALLNAATTAAMLRSRRRAAAAGQRTSPAPPDDGVDVSRTGVALVMAAFVLLQATNSAVVSVMALFVTGDLGLPVVWAGVALGVAAGAEVPALLLIGRLSGRVSDQALLVSGCLAGAAYYTSMAFVTGPVALVALQLLNAWFFGVVAGTGLTLFQRIVPRPGLAAGLYANSRRLGGIVSGPVIALGAGSAWGYSGAFAVCAGMTVVALAVIVPVLVRATSRPPQVGPPAASRTSA